MAGTNLIRFITIPILCLTLNALAQDPVSAMTQVKLHFDKQNDTHHSYHHQVIESIMEVTQDEFGPYKILKNRLASSDRRQAELISKGELLNLHWGPAGSGLSHANVIEIPIDILFGTLGYRICLINSNTSFPTRFYSLKDVQNIRIGQGYSWPDLQIYQHNGIKTVTAPGLSGLYQMLGAKRFECLPLGANEIVKLWEEGKGEYPFLTIETNLLIKYNFPVYFYVSKTEPKLAARVEKGLQQLQKSGELLTMFQKHFASGLHSLNLEQRKIICLDSPLLPNLKCEPALDFSKF